jgi:hypothetical protein
MTCLAPDRFVELLEGGLDRAPDGERSHLAACADCRDAWADLAGADGVLRAARPRRSWPHLYVAAAAAFLLALTAHIVLSIGGVPIGGIPAQEQPKDPVKLLMEGGEKEALEARTALFRQGVDALPALFEARRRCPEGVVREVVGKQAAARALDWYKKSGGGDPRVEKAAADLELKGPAARVGMLLDLIFDIKQAAAADDFAREIFGWTLTPILGMRSEYAPAPFEEFLQHIPMEPWVRKEWTVSIVLDPSLPADLRTRRVSGDTNLGPRGILDSLCCAHDLDYDVRFGVLFLSTPARLWNRPSSRELTKEEAARARSCIARLGGDSIEDREKARAELRTFGAAVLSLLEQGATASDRDAAALCRALLEELRRREPIPRANRWRTDPIEGKLKELGRDLSESKFTAKLAGLDLATALRRVGQSLRAKEVSLLYDDERLKGIVVPLLDLREVPAAQVLELLTLPYGLDAKLIPESGIVVVEAGR